MSSVALFSDKPAGDQFRPHGESIQPRTVDLPAVALGIPRVSIDRPLIQRLTFLIASTESWSRIKSRGDLIEEMSGKQAKILSEQQVEDLLFFAKTTRNPDRNRVIVLLSTKAGLRAAEIANLTWARRAVRQCKHAH
jgi:integrase